MGTSRVSASPELTVPLPVGEQRTWVWSVKVQVPTWVPEFLLTSRGCVMWLNEVPLRLPTRKTPFAS